jgi:hypothetical protein
MQLRDLQRSLQRYLLGGMGEGGCAGELAAAIAETPPLSVQARLGIYRHAYTARLIEALAETYPMLQRLLGEEQFEHLCTRFIDAHPSRHRSIRWYGRELAGFLALTRPFEEQPMLAELARLEWTLSEVFDAADAGTIDRAALASVEPARWAELGFRFHPSLRRLDLECNSVSVWQALEEGTDPGDAERASQPVPWLLWRRQFKNYFRSMDAAERAALDAATAGRSFAEICEILAAFVPEAEIPLRAAMLASSWADSGIIASLT